MTVMVGSSVFRSTWRGTTTSGIAGRIRYLSWTGIDDPAGAVAVTGSHFSPIANTTISTTPDTNSGTVARDRPLTLMAPSTGRPRLSAATIPAKMLSGTTITNATAASLSERP